MHRSDAVERLRRQADAVKARGATALYLFGSTARDEAEPGSDLDLFIDYDPSRKFSLVDLVGIKLFLEDQLGVDVDLTTRDSLHPARAWRHRHLGYPRVLMAHKVRPVVADILLRQDRLGRRRGRSAGAGK